MKNSKVYGFKIYEDSRWLFLRINKNDTEPRAMHAPINEPRMSHTAHQGL